MWWFLQRKAVKIDRRRSLAGVPVRNGGVFEKERTEDGLELVIVLKRGAGFLARFQPPVMERRLKLDELGCFVFDQIDGKRNTRQIVDAFAARYGVNRREAELSCVQFLRMLAQRHAVSITVK
ncbi:MAG: PqqD family protein [Lentisphaerae bacterium]|nr:PqqD family protein [Lentisphaerota bacterium]